MRVHRSNRTEHLFEALAQVLSEPTDDPFQPPWIVVQSGGMQRWLSVQLARKFGAWANAEFPFPRGVLERCMTAALGKTDPTSSVWSREGMRWAIWAQLEASLTDPIYAPVASYLAVDPTDTRRLQLAEIIADRFDQYLTFRPELIANWEKGAEVDDWQAALWRGLLESHGPGHFVHRALQYHARTQRGPIEGLPQRIAIFGIPSLPPPFLTLLDATSAHIPVDLFLLEPTAQYVALLQSQRSVARAEAKTGMDAEDLHLEIGNPLLASFGRLGRNFQDVLHSACEPQSGLEAFSLSPATHALATLQNDITEVQHRGTDAGPPANRLRKGDHSLTFHVCHSKVREMESLRDHIQAWLDDEPTRRPEEVVVMAPDVSTYAPAIAAVFGSDREGAHHIPYQVADRSLRAQGQEVDAFFCWLDLASSRMRSADVVDHLSRPPIAQRFGLSGSDVIRVQGWARDLPVLWGADGQHRAEEGQPDVSLHTWRTALDRLLLGVAMGGEEMAEGLDIAHHADMEGDALDTLARLLAYLEVVFALRALAVETHTPQEWSALLREHLLPAETPKERMRAWQVDALSGVLTDLASTATDADCDTPISFSAACWWVRKRVEGQRAGHAFGGGGLTFCSLLPMRSVPFHFVALIGMNQDGFPRTDRVPAFDKLSDSPRPGDRSRREEDRHLFLEALLSAREAVRLSWIGRSIHSNDEQPPSVVVTELRDWCDQALAPPRSVTEPSSDVLTTVHTLQPFSPRRFCEPSSPALGSHSEAYAEAARHVQSDEEAVPALIRSPLQAEDNARDTMQLHQLDRCLASPSRTLLQQRLRLHLDRKDDTLSDRIQLPPTGLERYRMREALWQHVLAGRSIEDTWDTMKHHGAFPPGAAGRAMLESFLPEITALREAALPWTSQARLQPLAVELAVPTFRGSTTLSGTLQDLYPDAQVLMYTSSLGAERMLHAWLRHLCLCASRDASHPEVTIAIGPQPGGKSKRDQGPLRIVRFTELGANDPLDLLSGLANLAERSLTEPVPFFPRIREAFVQGRGNEEDRISAAIGTWKALIAPPRPNAAFFQPHDPWSRQLYRDLDPFDPAWPYAVSFVQAAESVFSPLYQHTRRA